jgi:polysaccharide export outer membrane protein
MKLRIGIACVLLLLFAAGRLEAQDAAQPPAQNGAQEPPDPQLKPNPIDALRNFEPAADEEYRLGRGDEIVVDFSGRPEMQAKLVVGPDGRISLPLIGDILLADHTRSEAAKAIEAKLAEYYSNMAVMVTVTRYTSNKILLLGAVERPGVLVFEGTPTLLEALTRGGLVTGTSKIGQIPERCAIYRGHDQVIWVQLKELIESGNSLADLRLRRDDVIYVPNMAEHFVSVLGEVTRPGAIPLTSTSTLATILASAGGFSDKAGNMPHIEIVDPASGSSRNLSFSDVLNPVKSLEITLKPGEIVFVPRSGFYKATYVLERLNPLTTVMTMAMLTGAL